MPQPRSASRRADPTAAVPTRRRCPRGGGVPAAAVPPVLPSGARCSPRFSANSEAKDAGCAGCDAARRISGAEASHCRERWAKIAEDGRHNAGPSLFSSLFPPASCRCRHAVFSPGGPQRTSGVPAIRRPDGSRSRSPACPRLDAAFDREATAVLVPRDRAHSLRGPDGSHRPDRLQRTGELRPRGTCAHRRDEGHRTGIVCDGADS